MGILEFIIWLSGICCVVPFLALIVIVFIVARYDYKGSKELFKSK